MTEREQPSSGGTPDKGQAGSGEPPRREADAFLGRSRLGDATVGQHMVRGSAWAVGWRWAVRSIGLVSTIILARLLTPADFGLVAMAMVVVGFIEIFGETGQALALLRYKNPTREHYDTAWTLQVAIGILLAVVMIAAAPLGAIYFNEPRVQPLIYFLSLRALIGGFENIGIVAFRANLDFQRDFLFGLYQKLSTFFLTIGLAIYLRDYWALAFGIVISRVISTGLSYRMHPFRPRLSLAKRKDIFGFSIWTLFTQIGNYLSNKVDEFVVGGLSGTTAMGSYAVASDMAAAPTIELVVPMTRALYPIYSQFADDRERLRDSYLGVLSVVGVLCFSTAAGVAVVANDVVAVALGPQWLSAAPLIVWLALGSAAMALGDGVLTIFNVTGRPAISSGAVATRVLALIPGVTLAGWLWGIEAVAMARAAIYIAMLPSLFFMLKRVIPVRNRDILSRLWRPFVGAALMFGVVKLCHPAGIETAALRLAVDVPVGAATFAAVVFLLWFLSGRPAGVEETAAKTFQRLWRRLRLRRALEG